MHRVPQGRGASHVTAFSSGLSDATEEQQVYSALWGMPMLQDRCKNRGCILLHPRREAMREMLCVCVGGRKVQASHHGVPQRSCPR
jgi:hypothetical protein